MRQTLRFARREINSFYFVHSFFLPYFPCFYDHDEIIFDLSLSRDNVTIECLFICSRVRMATKPSASRFLLVS